MKTIAISEQDHHTLKRWSKAKGMNMQMFINSWIKAAENKMQQEFYSGLPRSTKYRKPLEAIKIKKNYKNSYGV